MGIRTPSEFRDSDYLYFLKKTAMMWLSVPMGDKKYRQNHGGIKSKIYKDDQF